MEIGVLKHIYDSKNVDQIRGNPGVLVATIDTYAAATTPLMTIGPKKRDYIIDIMAKATPGPKTFIEFGAYVGYSAVALASALRDFNKGHKVRYISLEMNPVYAAITASFAELAGLKDVVEVHVAPAGDSLKRMLRDGGLKEGEADFMLVDHWQSAYLPDLKLCEQLNVFKKGTIIVADNVIYPGAPDYLAYVTKGIAERSSEGLRYETITTEDFKTPWAPVSYYELFLEVKILINAGQAFSINCSLRQPKVEGCRRRLRIMSDEFSYSFYSSYHVM